MLKKIGSWIGSAKRYVRDVQNQVSDITDATIEGEKKNINESKKSKESNEK